MIARCPQCDSRYRVASEKVGPQGARLRCTKCQNVFRVEPSQTGDAVSATPPTAASRPLSRALVAEADGQAAKSVVEFLSRWQIPADVVADGAEALLWVHRKRPGLVVLGGHLPAMAAPVVTEIIRRTVELKSVRVIRVAPIDEPAGAPEFDADYTLEPGDLPNGLGDLLERLGVGQRPAAPAPKPAPVAKPMPAATPSPAAAPAPPPAQSAHPPAAAPVDSELAGAERLTRIIVSDIILYDDTKFQRAVREGNVLEAFENELAEAKALFHQRVPEKVRSKRDFLSEELQARAEKRRQSL